MINEWRTFAFPSGAEARNYMVPFGSRHTRDCVNKILKRYNFKHTSGF